MERADITSAGLSCRDVRVDSYFSLPTDLAEELGSWPEFLSGQGYEVELRSDDEHVLVQLEKDQDTPFVRIRGAGAGPLFHRVLGVVIHALSANSDSVWVTRWSA